MKLKVGSVMTDLSNSDIRDTPFFKSLIPILMDKIKDRVPAANVNQNIYDEAVKCLKAEYSEVELLILGIEIDEEKESGNK